MLFGRSGLDTPPKTIGDLLGDGLVARLDRLDVLSRKVFSGKMPGERRSKKRGQSVEFDDYRQYVPGDDLRRIDWNVFARHDKFVLKLFKEDEDLGVHILLDDSPSMHAGEPPKRIAAHRLAASLGYIGLVNQNRVTISLLRQEEGTPTLLRPSSMRGRSSVQRLSAFVLGSLNGTLAESGISANELTLRPPTEPLSAGLIAFAKHLGIGGVVFVISDLLEPVWLDPESRRTPLNALVAGGKADPVCLQVLSPSELDPTLDVTRGLTGDLRLTDAETGVGVEATVNATVLRAVRERIDGYIEGVGRDCAARAILHRVVPSDADIAELIFGGMRRRGVLG
ncbi:MAG: DUF58 domain-containing protein [Planctomycetota bacterium]